MTKVKKTFSKRIRVTKTGKLVRRVMGSSHFKAKKSPKVIREKRNSVLVAAVDEKAILARL